METKIVKNLEEFSECVEENQEIYYFLKKGQGTISEYIENSGLDDDILLNLKVAYNFSVDVLLENKRTKDKLKVESIEEIVKKIDKNKEEEYRVILKSNDKTIMSDVIQQFIYLDMKSLDIVTEEELKQVARYESLKENKEDLKSFIQEFKNKVIAHSSNNKEINKDKEYIVEKISKLENHLKEIEDRPLKVCVMATKKSGKSVIVNSFLEDEYAPTSMKLATPNTVVYESWNKDTIECRVEADSELKGYAKESIKEFSDSNEVKKYINKLFKHAEKDEKNKFAMPDIYIKYPKRELEYTIIDTPGPDLAGAGHSKIAYKWIEQADAVIFAIDYSKYLTDGEEKFLRDIKAKLEEKEKFHSLIIVVNKLDLRYSSNEKKSVVDFLDFLKGRLTSLGYADIPIMGITSLQYYSSLEVQKLIEKKSYDFNKDEVLTEEFFDDINDFELSSADKTYISFIEDSKQKLKRFHKKRKSTLNDLDYHSGMPSLIDRVRYITTTKASVEIFNNTFSKMDRDFNEIKNNFLAIKIKELLSQKEKIINDLNEIDNYFKKKEEEISSVSNKELGKPIKDKLNITFQEFTQDAKLRIASSLDTKKNEILEEEKVLTVSYEQIIKGLEKPLEKMVNDSISDINELKNDYINEMEKNIINLNNDIQEKIKEKEFEKKYNLKISLSKLEPKLAREKFTIQFNEMFSNLVLGGETINAIEKQEREEKIDKFWFAWFRSDEYKTVEYEVINEEKLNEQIKQIEQKLFNSVSFIIKQQTEDAKKSLDNQLANFDKIIQNELEEIIKSYVKTNSNIRYMLDSSKDNIQEVEIFYKNIHTEFVELNDIWDLIVEGQ